MDNTFDIIIKILKRLEVAMDEDDPDFSDIQPGGLEISDIKWVRIFQMIYERGLIDGVDFTHFIGQEHPEVSFNDLRITLSGLEYLADNTSTAKLIKAAKLLKDTIPGI